MSSSQKYMREYYLANKKKIIARRMEYYRTHKQEECIYTKQYQRKNRKRIAELQRQWYWDNHEHALENKRRWSKTKKGILSYRAWNQKRCAKGSYINRKIVESILQSNVRKYGMLRCVYCEKRLTLHMVWVDHVVPIAKGGKSEKKNLVVSCSKCNRRKSSLDKKEFLKRMVA